jgi:hypothetical protein
MAVASIATWLVVSATSWSLLRVQLGAGQGRDVARFNRRIWSVVSWLTRLVVRPPLAPC